MQLKCMYCNNSAEDCTLLDYFSLVSTLKCRACRGKLKNALNYKNNKVAEF